MGNDGWSFGKLADHLPAVMRLTMILNPGQLLIWLMQYCGSRRLCGRPLQS